MNRYVPKRRFKGFIETWEVKKLGEVTYKIDYGLNAPAGRYDGENKYIRITDIDETTRIFLNTDLTSPEYNLETADNYLLKNKDILFARTGASVGKSYIYRKSDGKVYFAGFLIRFRIDNNHSDEFIYQYTFTKHYKKFVLITSQRSGQPGINSQEYAEMRILFPLLSEQKLIGSFFKNLDEQIDKQGKKVEKLKNLKNAYLSEMFPAEGELSPKRRFKGFTEPWKEKKLDKISHRLDNQRIPISENKRIPGNIPYYGANGIQDFVRGYTHDGEHVLLAEDGANDLIDYPVQYVLGKIWVNNHAHVLKGKENILDNKFLYVAIKNMDLRPYLVGGGRAKLNADIMMNLVILIPPFEEQKLIGSFFKKLDDEINLEQKKLEKLKQLKQAYLEEMFV